MILQLSLTCTASAVLPTFPSPRTAIRQLSMSLKIDGGVMRRR